MQYEVETTDEYDVWFDGLRDRKAAQIVAKRIVRMAGGWSGMTGSFCNRSSPRRDK